MSLFGVHLVLVAAGFLAASGFGVAALRWRHAGAAVYGACALIAAAVAGLAVAQAILAPIATLHLPMGLPGAGTHLRIDALSTVFLVIVNVTAALVSLYAVGYGRHEPEPGRVLPTYPLFLLGMNVVLVADDAFAFLLGWEFMSLASWAMVVARHRDAEARQAGHLYLTMAAGGGVALLFAFGVLAGPDGGYAFDAIRARELSGWLPPLALALVLAGTGSKAGLVPMHVWLPLAHPAAPSHVSALMSGAMTKVAIYGLVRFLFDLMPPPEWWWAVPLLLVGIVSAVVGLVHAIAQDDLKKLLAYSTIENVGIVTVALGLAVAFSASGLKASAAVALTAALLHVANHAAMKSLLFSAAGAMAHATGTRDLDRLGGLVRAMPKTSALMLTGAAAIAGLPPLNGFASEWLVFQAVLSSPDLKVDALRFLVPAVGALLALVAALAAACFVRAFGIACLGRPRTPEAARAGDPDRWSLAAMAILAALCLAGGVFAPLLVEALRPAVTALVGAGLPEQAAAGPAPLSLTPFDGARSTYNGLVVLAFLVLSATATALVIHRFATRATRRAPAWDCGYPDPSIATQYTASSFGQPVRRVFGPLGYIARERVSMPEPGSTEPAHHRLVLLDPVWVGLFVPIGRAVEAVSDRLNVLQFLTIRRYLTLVFLVLVALLLGVVLWR